jgi:hypothetical protein
MATVDLFESLQQRRHAEEEDPTASSTYVISGINSPGIGCSDWLRHCV